MMGRRSAEQFGPAHPPPEDPVERVANAMRRVIRADQSHCDGHTFPYAQLAEAAVDALSSPDKPEGQTLECPRCHRPISRDLIEHLGLTDLDKPEGQRTVLLDKAAQALRELVLLKNGPRDETYYAAKPHAWDRARAIVDKLESGGGSR